MKCIPLFVLICVHCLFGAQRDSLSIEKEIRELSKTLSFYPPAIKDSTHKKELSTGIERFLAEIRATTYDEAIKHIWYAEIYTFICNMRAKNSIENCLYLYEKAITLKPKSVRARIGYVKFYSSLCLSPNVKGKLKAEKPFSILIDLIKEGVGEDQPSLYWYYGVLSMYLYELPFLYEAVFKYEKYLPKGDKIEPLKNFLKQTKDSCFFMEHTDGTIKYHNACKKFSIAYPDEMILNTTGIVGNDSWIYLIETPLTENDDKRKIRNSVGINVKEKGSLGIEDLWSQFNKKKIFKIIKNMQLNSGTVKLTRIFVSKPGTTPGMKDDYMGIYTLYEGERYYYELVYTATKSTFHKNATYYSAVKRSLTFD